MSPAERQARSSVGLFSGWVPVDKYEKAVRGAAGDPVAATAVRGLLRERRRDGDNNL